MTCAHSEPIAGSLLRLDSNREGSEENNDATCHSDRNAVRFGLISGCWAVRLNALAHPAPRQGTQGFTIVK